MAARDQEPGVGPAFYITARVGEVIGAADASLTVARGPEGEHLTYWDEMLGDRDSKGVLWTRCSQTLSRTERPVGQPASGLHPDRQYGLQLHRYCGACGCPARLGDGRYLHLVTEDERMEDGVVRTVHPPVCLGHAAACAARDPRLRGGFSALLVGASALWGVVGTLYEPVGRHEVRPRPGGPRPIPYGADAEILRWALAGLLVRDLSGLEEVVDLDRFLRESSV
ncbi:hypothetical protein EF908_27500 [Streptomyces sp. WAC04770]|nr:hypothetical protein [Streptomyces sp. WAC04770]RST20450.1 hypothetical protein EF908_27500 [Streptomyces sp. WAC04770]